jgi:hypothetical protein
MHNHPDAPTSPTPIGAVKIKSAELTVGGIEVWKRETYMQHGDLVNLKFASNHFNEGALTVKADVIFETWDVPMPPNQSQPVASYPRTLEFTVDVYNKAYLYGTQVDPEGNVSQVGNEHDAKNHSLWLLAAAAVGLAERRVSVSAARHGP